MIVDSRDDDSEAVRLLSAGERVAVACHVAEQILTLSRLARMQRPPTSRVQRVISAFTTSTHPPLPPALARVGSICSELLSWLTGAKASYPTLDDLLRAIGETLNTMDPTERRFATQIAMAASILAAAAIARNRRKDDTEASGAPPEAIKEMIEIPNILGFHHLEHPLAEA